MSEINWKESFEIVDLLDKYTQDTELINSLPIVYHYCSFQNASSITHGFNSRCINSTFYHKRSDLFKDKTEGKEIVDLYLAALGLYLGRYHLNNDMIFFLKNISPDDIYPCYCDISSSITGVARKKCEAYIACFSLDGDSKYMWDKYLKGSKSGISLGYSLLNLNEVTNESMGEGYKHVIRKILYSKTEKVLFILNFLEELLPKCADKSFVKYSINAFLNLNKFIFKKPDYADEKEVRSIILKPDDCNTLNCDKDKRIIEFNFGQYVPVDEMFYYYKTENQNEKSQLRQLSPHIRLNESKFNSKQTLLSIKD